MKTKPMPKTERKALEAFMDALIIGKPKAEIKSLWRNLRRDGTKSNDDHLLA